MLSLLKNELEKKYAIWIEEGKCLRLADSKGEELNQKLERLSELNALLNMDEREDAEAEVSESDEKEERPARG